MFFIVDYLIINQLYILQETVTFFDDIIILTC